MKDVLLLLAIASAAMVPGILIFKINEGIDAEIIGEKKPVDWHMLLPIMLIVSVGAVFMSRYYYDMSLRALTPAIFLLAQLWPVAYLDRYYHLITNKSLMVMILFRLLILGVAAWLQPSAMAYILISSAIGALSMMAASFLCRLTVPNSVGYGDVKLLGVVGFYLGIDQLPPVILLSLLALFFAALYLLVVKKADRKSELAFAPFLLIGTVLGIFLMAV